MDDNFDWMIIYPQPFSKDRLYNKRITGPINPDRVEFNSEIDAWVFYAKDIPICSRSVQYPNTIGIEKQEDGLWYWKIERKEDK